MRAVKRWVTAALLLYLLAWAIRIYVRKYYLWLPGYVQWVLQPRETPPDPVHIFFFYADDFEPSGHLDRTRRWVNEYPAFADRHRDSDGRPLQHTWFYPGDDPWDENMKGLQRLVAGGYGEVELHLHHHNDTQESAAQKYRKAIAYFQTYGFLKTMDGRTRFGFVHGNGGLDSGRGAAFCGANRELSLLRELGCYADFSYPGVWQTSQPACVNQIFDATDDDGPNSHRRGVPLEAGRPKGGDLTIFQGPLMIAPSLNPGRLFFEIVDGDIHPSIPASERRVDLWVRANIHVKGRPDWVFIKVNGHAAGSEEDLKETLGPNFDRALSYLERRYNDGIHYKLHYVTARQAFNLARAAADSQRGEPKRYFDWVVKPYVANSSSSSSPAR